MKIWRSAAIAVVALCMSAGAVLASPKVGQAAPDFTVTTFTGRVVKLSDLKGDVIILNFWATWCALCRRELPLLEVLFRDYSKYGLQVLAVATEDSVPQDKLRILASHLTIPFIKKMKGPYHDQNGEVPTNFVIDRSGKLVYAQAGAFDIDSFNAIVVPLLREPIPDTPPPAASPGSTATPAPAAAN